MPLKEPLCKHPILTDVLCWLVKILLISSRGLTLTPSKEPLYRWPEFSRSLFRSLCAHQNSDSELFTFYNTSEMI